MHSPLKDLIDDFSRRLTSLESTRKKIESLYTSGHIAGRDVEHVYEAIFLSSMTTFEALLENLFFGLLMGRYTSGLPNARCKISIRSEQVGREILLGGGAYLDWLPYSRTEDRAKLYFASGLPFTILNDGEKSFLKQSLFIRNAVAHKSRFAMEQFREKVNGVSGLPPRQRTPAGFLRSVFRAAPIQCRYENFAAHLALIVNRLCR